YRTSFAYQTTGSIKPKRFRNHVQRSESHVAAKRTRTSCFVKDRLLRRARHGLVVPDHLRSPLPIVRWHRRSRARPLGTCGLRGQENRGSIGATFFKPFHRLHHLTVL